MQPSWRCCSRFCTRCVISSACPSMTRPVVMRRDALCVWRTGSRTMSCRDRTRGGRSSCCRERLYHNYVWDPARDALVTVGYRVLRFDCFARGWSDRPDADYDLDMFERQLDGLVMTIVAPSFPVGQRANFFRPERFPDWAARYGEQMRYSGIRRPLVKTLRGDATPSGRIRRAWRCTTARRRTSNPSPPATSASTGSVRIATGRSTS